MMPCRYPLCGAVLLAFCLTTGGAWADWTMLGGDPEHTSYAADPIKLPISLRWKYATEDKNAEARAWSSPAVTDDSVVFCYGEKVYCVDISSGAERWSYDARTLMRSSPAVVDGVVYVGGDDGNLFAISEESGHVLWKYPIGKTIDSSPMVADGVLYVGSDDGSVYAIDLQQQNLRWQFKTGGPVKTSPTLYRSVCYVGSTDGYVYAVDSQGKLVWKQVLANYTELFMSPAVERGKVIAGAHKFVYALDAKSGAHRWRFEAADVISGVPAIANRMVYVGSKDGKLYGLSANSGTVRWAYPPRNLAGQPILSGPVVRGDTVFVRANNGVMLGVDAMKGTLKWQYKMEAPPEKKKTEKKAGAGAMPGMAPGAPGMEGMGMPGMGGMEGMGMPGVGDVGAPGGEAGRYQRGRRRSRRDVTSRRRGIRAGADAGMEGGGIGGIDRMGGGPGGTGRYQRSEREQLEFKDNIRSSVAVTVNGLYALGDDGALYALTSDAADNTPPEIRDPLLDLPGEERTTFQVPLDLVDGDEIPGKFADSVQVPGTPPLRVSMLLKDDGSGLDMSTVKVSLNGQPVEFIYQEKETLLWWVYDPRGIARALRDGEQDLVVEATDYRGHKAVKSMSWIVDNTLPAPAIEKRKGLGGEMMPGMPGEMMPGMPGEMAPGAMMPAAPAGGMMSPAMP